MLSGYGSSNISVVEPVIQGCGIDWGSSAGIGAQERRGGVRGDGGEHRRR